MKIYLIDPKKKWLKTNLHCHTTNSDGYFTPEEIKKYYMEEGYSVVAYTDHELLFDVSYLTDDKFIAITSTEYSINEENKNWRDREVFHLSLFSKDPHNIVHPAASEKNFNETHHEKYNGKEIKCDGYTRVFTKESVQETIDRANEAGFLVQLNHPNWSLNKREDYIDLKGLWSLEVLNYLTEIESGTEYCINIYDDMIRNGHKIFCTMGDDNHNYGGSFEGSFGGFNYIGVNEFSYDDCLKAMEDGYIYASSGPKIKSLYIDKDTDMINVECSNATDIILTGYNRLSRHEHGENLKKASFHIEGDEVYFRITIKNKYGKVAHTHMYYLKDLGYKAE